MFVLRIAGLSRIFYATLNSETIPTSVITLQMLKAKKQSPSIAFPDVTNDPDKPVVNAGRF